MCICSCKFISFELLQFHISVLEDADYYNDDVIEISSSYSLRTEDFESLVSLSIENQYIEVDFNWIDDRKVYLMPKLDWKYGEQYLLSIKGKCRTLCKGNFEINEKRYFKYGKENEEFKLISVPVMIFASLDEKIIFEFNKPVNQSSFINAFSLNPYCDYKIMFSSDNHEVTIQPSDKWNLNEKYKWELSEKILSSDNYKLEKNYSGTINSVYDSDLPVLLDVKPVKIINEQFLIDEENELKELTTKQAIAFVFSKSMDLQSVEKNISFNPSVKGYVCSYNNDQTIFIFQPEENYECGKEYQIIVEENCYDTNGLELYKTYEKYFSTINNYLEVVSIKVYETEILNQNVPVFVEKNADELKLTIKFSDSIKDLTVCEKNINFLNVFPAYLTSPVKKICEWNYEHNEVTIVYCNLKTLEYESYYKLNISGKNTELFSAAGTAMKEDVCVILCTK